MAGQLPVGPICNPSVESVEAALYPTVSDNLYFVADKNGEVYYTKTLPNFLLGGQDPTVRLLFGLLGAVYLLLFCRFLIIWRRLRKD